MSVRGRLEDIVGKAFDSLTRTETNAITFLFTSDFATDYPIVTSSIAGLAAFGLFSRRRSRGVDSLESEKPFVGPE